jgi:hypothetical protein
MATAAAAAAAAEGGARRRGRVEMEILILPSGFDEGLRERGE